MPDGKADRRLPSPRRRAVSPPMPFQPLTHLPARLTPTGKSSRGSDHLCPYCCSDPAPHPWNRQPAGRALPILQTASDSADAEALDQEHTTIWTHRAGMGAAWHIAQVDEAEAR